MQDKISTLAALSAAALLLNTMSNTARANPPDQKVTLDYRFTAYNEGDIPADKLAFGSENRYSIDIHQFKAKTPVANNAEFTISVSQETMSGASPWYVIAAEDSEPVQVMSGATIEEIRSEIGIDYRAYKDNTESTVSISHSREQDYISYALGYSSAWYLKNKRTTINYGISGTQDYIDATDATFFVDRPTDEKKIRVGGFFGFSHVMSKNRLIGMSISMSALDGYLSDTYKLTLVEDALIHDNRPDTQSRQSVSLMLRQFVPAAHAALHFDMRLYQNNWEMTSETVDLSWHQNIGSTWQIVPSFRYYNQSEAAFYAPFYTRARQDGFYSSDYRLSAFSASSGRLKVIKRWQKFTANFSYETYSSAGDHPGLVSFDMLSLGLGAKF